MDMGLRDSFHPFSHTFDSRGLRKVWGEAESFLALAIHLVLCGAR